ncbi:hypothetical protein E2P81_ATG04175 [Venturia nashicola]|nr:hypothetical protein E2P81_ATG04175 [Venturia nashicola]
MLTLYIGKVMPDSSVNGICIKRETATAGHKTLGESLTGEKESWGGEVPDRGGKQQSVWLGPIRPSFRVSDPMYRTGTGSVWISYQWMPPRGEPCQLHQPEANEPCQLHQPEANEPCHQHQPEASHASCISQRRISLRREVSRTSGKDVTCQQSDYRAIEEIKETSAPRHQSHPQHQPSTPVLSSTPTINSTQSSTHASLTNNSSILPSHTQSTCLAVDLLPAPAPLAAALRAPATAESNFSSPQSTTVPVASSLSFDTGPNLTPMMARWFER